MHREHKAHWFTLFSYTTNYSGYNGGKKLYNFIIIIYNTLIVLLTLHTFVTLHKFVSFRKDS